MQTMSRWPRLLTTLTVLLALSGCSTVKGWFTVDDDESNQPAKLIDIDTEISIRKLWSTGVGSGQGDGYYHLRPTIDGATIYAAGNDGTVLALDRMKGKRIWRQEFDLSLSGGVGVGDNMVLLGSSDGQVLALNKADGSELWIGQVSGEVLAPPQTNGKVVVVQSYDGVVQGLSAEDGSQLWLYDSNVPVLTLRGTSTPVIFERMVMVGFGNGKVLALDIETGAVRWEARVAIAQGRSEIDRIVDIDGTLLMVGSVVYAVSYQGRVAAIDVTSGRKLWQQEVSSYVGLDQGFGNIYVADEKGSVIAYYRNGQGVRWEQPALSYRRLSSPTAIKGYVAVGDLDGYVHFMSQVDGHFVGRVKVDGDGVRANMLAEDNILYVFGNSGTLAAYQVSSQDKK
jgi:outer membrane protein assembly factor BamB